LSCTMIAFRAYVAVVLQFFFNVRI
jgi:hypothetical protein